MSQIISRGDVFPIERSNVSDLLRWSMNHGSKFYPDTFYPRRYLIFLSGEEGLLRAGQSAPKAARYIATTTGGNANDERLVLHRLHGNILDRHSSSFINPQTDEMHGHKLPVLGGALFMGAIATQASSVEKLVPAVTPDLSVTLDDLPNGGMEALSQVNPLFEHIFYYAGRRLRPSDEQASAWIAAGALAACRGLEQQFNRFN